MPPVCLYIKCRPQGADILDLCRAVGRVFIGYPPLRRDAEYERRSTTRWMLDIGGRADQWDASALHEDASDRGYRSKITFHRRLAASVGEGSIVLVPRPGSGTLFVARIGAFELVESPTWIDDYCRARRNCGLEADPERSHAGDVVQSFPLRSAMEQVPFVAAPRWLTSQTLSRTTSGILDDGPPGEPSAFEVAERLLRRDFAQDWLPTSDPAAVLVRLMRGLGPAAFEVLVCELLQLDAAPGVRWSHVGGSGDGGVDGLALGLDGRPVAGLTCKFALNTDASRLGTIVREDLKAAWGGAPVGHVAWLRGPAVVPPAPEGVEYLDGLDVARRLIAHRDRCGFARMLSVV